MRQKVLKIETEKIATSMKKKESRTLLLKAKHIGLKEVNLHDDLEIFTKEGRSY